MSVVRLWNFTIDFIWWWLVTSKVFTPQSSGESVSMTPGEEAHHSPQRIRKAAVSIRQNGSDGSREPSAVGQTASAQCRRQQGRAWRDQLLFACVCKGKQAQYELPEPLGSCHLWISLSASREREFWLGLSCNAPWTSNWACDPPNPKTLPDLICLCLSVVFYSVLEQIRPCIQE